jgi:hypothetical protein
MVKGTARQPLRGFALALLIGAGGCKSISVEPVEYTFKTPLATAPIG